MAPASWFPGTYAGVLVVRDTALSTASATIHGDSASILPMANLALSNKHLSSAAKREKAVRLTIATSSAVEGIRAPFKAKAVKRAVAKKVAKKR